MRTRALKRSTCEIRATVVIDPAIHPELAEALVEGDQLGVRRDGVRGQIAVAPQFGRRLGQARVLSERFVDPWKFGKEPHPDVPVERFVHAPSLLVSERAPLHGGGGGQAAQEPDL